MAIGLSCETSHGGGRVENPSYEDNFGARFPYNSDRGALANLSPV